LAIASDPEAQAEIAVQTPAFAPSSRPMTAAAPFGMNFCTTNGDTARRPLARMPS
jgi:hypothetical protein